MHTNAHQAHTHRVYMSQYLRTDCRGWFGKFDMGRTHPACTDGSCILKGTRLRKCYCTHLLPPCLMGKQWRRSVGKRTFLKSFDTKFSWKLQYEIFKSRKTWFYNIRTVKFRFDCSDDKISFEQSFSNFQDFDATLNFSDVENDLVDEISTMLIQSIFNKAAINW